MGRFFFFAVALFSQSAQAQCRLCPTEPSKDAVLPTIPLRIDVEAALDLGRAAQGRSGGGGTITLDPATGERRVTGLADLGGFSLKGTVRLQGAPSAPVSISMPSRISLAAPDGSTAEIIDIRTNLGSAARLDGLGQLSFAFGGRLVVTGGQAGDFRGRVTVVADYR